jgi:hypothetical protein
VITEEKLTRRCSATIDYTKVAIIAIVTIKVFLSTNAFTPINRYLFIYSESPNEK